MKEFITNPASASLRSIITYYKSEGHETYAERLRELVIAKTKTLSQYYLRGQEDEFLKPLDQGHRYVLVEKHFKIVYLVEYERVLVTDVFDTRQQPEKLMKRHQK